MFQAEWCYSKYNLGCYNLGCLGKNDRKQTRLLLQQNEIYLYRHSWQCMMHVWRCLQQSSPNMILKTSRSLTENPVVSSLMQNDKSQRLAQLKIEILV